jgi:hypothetical protein
VRIFGTRETDRIPRAWVALAFIRASFDGNCASSAPCAPRDRGGAFTRFLVGRPSPRDPERDVAALDETRACGVTHRNRSHPCAS